MERAGFGIRLVALLIDALILGIISYVLDSLLGLVVNTDPVNPITGELSYGPGYWLSLLVSLLLAFIYSVWIPLRTNGQTPGKKLLKIRIAKINGEPLSVGALLLREFIGKTVSTIILFIGYLMAFGKEKRALHDYMAGTVVVRDQ